MTYRFLLLLCVFKAKAEEKTPVQIDNGVVGEPEVMCESDSLSLLFESRQNFVGKVFVKGHAGDESCVQMGSTGSDHKHHRFRVSHDGCGVRRRREANGIVVSTTVIVSFHSIFITKVDRAYRVSCFYVETTKRVQQQLDVASLATQAIDRQTALPVCRYEILSGGPSGSAARYAHIGDTVYHKWSCAAEMPDVYCMRVHSCTVYDGQGGPPVTVIDVNGCSVDGVILQDLEYLGDLSAGKPAQVFKFADKSGMYFNCQIQLTIKEEELGCVASRPKCGRQTFVEPAQKSEEEDEGYESEESPIPTVTTSSGTTTVITTTTSLPITARRAASNGAPGIAPTSSYVLNAVNTTMTPVYSRIVRREIKKIEQRNRTFPSPVADFELPEQALIIFGLEDDEDGSSRHLMPTSIGCAANDRALTLSLLTIVVLSLLLMTAAFIVYRQRQAFTELIFKS